MKARTGFVSNSSSSSFVILGYQLTTDDISKLNKVAEEKDMDFYELIYESDYIGDYEFLTESDHENVIGESIANVDEYYMEADQISLKTLKEKSKKIVEDLSKIGIQANEDDVQIYTGTRAC